jgi:glycosyltransferase involved in cell wall biosynthesis
MLMEIQAQPGSSLGGTAPLISVIIPTYNSERTIAQTVESVLNQSFSSLELIVVDDGSTDSTLTLLDQIADPRLAVHRYHQSGVAASRNRGLALAAGRFVAFLDHDDIWTPDKLEAQYEALQDHPQAAAAYSLVDCIDESGRFLHPGSRVTVSGDLYARLLLTDFVDTISNPLLRKHALEDVGGFNESTDGADDWDVLLRLAAKHPFVCVPRVQVLYREHPDSLSFDVSGMEDAILRVSERAFAAVPASFQHLKRVSLGNSYKYLTTRALRGHPSRRRGLLAARFLGTAVRRDPLLSLTPACAYSLVIIVAMILLPRFVRALTDRMERIPRANALLRHIHNDPFQVLRPPSLAGLATLRSVWPWAHRGLSGLSDLRISRNRAWLPVAFTLVLVLVALRGYEGGRAWRLGPPFGAVLGQDFRAVLRAADEIRAGENPYAYALAFAQSPSFQQFHTWEVAPYPYPLLAALLAQPLTGLKPETAANLWIVLNLALVVGCALLALGALRGVTFGRSAVRFVFILVLFYLYGPTQINLLLGQLDMVILFLLLLSYLLYGRSHDSAAGVSLALAVALNPTTVAVLGFFAWKRAWRLAGTFTATFALVTAAGFGTAGWDLLPDYLEVTRSWSRGALLAFPHNQSVTGLARRAFTPNVYIVPLKAVPWLGQALPILVASLAIGSWLIATTRRDNRTEPTNSLEYGLTVTTLMLIWPQFSDIHYVWALVPISTLLLTTMDSQLGLRSFLLLALSFLVALYLGYAPVQDLIYTGSQSLLQAGELVERRHVLRTGAYLYGLVALHLCLVIQLHRQRTDDRGQLPFAPDQNAATGQEMP